MSWKFNSSHINSLTVSNLRTDVTSNEFFQKTFYGGQLVGKLPNTLIALCRQVIIRTKKTMLLTKQHAGV